MARKIYSAKSQFVNTNTTRTLHAGPGKIYAIIASNDAAATDIGFVTLYDGITAAPAPALGKFAFNVQTPLVIILPQNMPMLFETALTVVTSTNARAFIITEAEI